MHVRILVAHSGSNENLCAFEHEWQTKHLFDVLQDTKPARKVQNKNPEEFERKTLRTLGMRTFPLKQIILFACGICYIMNVCSLPILCVDSRNEL